MATPLSERVQDLPTGPGVYLFKSARGTILYVGKAQNLRSRVKQYVGGGDGRIRIPALMERAVDVDVLVTPTVKDALLLENELIKRHRPQFNVRLRDDKQYLALRLDPKEKWPRLREVRRFAQDGAEYFAPALNNPEFLDAASDGFLQATIARGRGRTPMRPFGEGSGGIAALSESQISDIVSHIRTWDEAGR